jgi:hypothetical protein
MAVVSRSEPTPPLAALGDSRLVELAGRGDQHAFEALVQRHHRRLLVRVQRVLPPDHASQASPTAQPGPHLLDSGHLTHIRSQCPGAATPRWRGATAHDD